MVATATVKIRWMFVTTIVALVVACAMTLVTVIVVSRRPADPKCPLPPKCPVVVVDAPPPAIRVAMDPNASGAPPDTFPQIGYISSSAPSSAPSPTTASPMPLYGNASNARRGRWFYYTIIGGIKVPVEHRGRSCMDEIACEQLSDGDRVRVPDDHSGDKIARIYENRGSVFASSKA